MLIKRIYENDDRADQFINEAFTDFAKKSNVDLNFEEYCFVQTAMLQLPHGKKSARTRLSCQTYGKDSACVFPAHMNGTENTAANSARRLSQRKNQRDQSPEFLKGEPLPDMPGESGRMC